MKTLFQRLPLLDYADSLFPEIDLSDTLVIGVRHLLQSHYIFFRYLEKRGLRPDHVHLIGKVYTTNATVRDAYLKRGYHISEYSSRFDSHESFDSQFDRYVDCFIDEVNQKIKRRAFSKVVVLDDGGMIFRRIARLQAKNIVGVEQTSAGFNLLGKNKFSFPILNVGRSKGKLVRETPHVIGVFMGQYEKKIDLSVSHQTLIVGGGYIGKEAARQLKLRGQEVKIYDLLPHRSDFKEKDLRRILPGFDIVIGTTGKPSVSQADLKHLKKGAVLVSLSSSDREFPAPDVRRKFPKNSDPYRDYELKGFRLLNAGFPMTFVGQVQPMPLKYMQITSSLIYSSILYGVSNKALGTGFIPVPSRIQDPLIARFKKIHA